MRIVHGRPRSAHTRERDALSDSVTANSRDFRIDDREKTRFQTPRSKANTRRDSPRASACPSEPPVPAAESRRARTTTSAPAPTDCACTVQLGV